MKLKIAFAVVTVFAAVGGWQLNNLTDYMIDVQRKAVQYDQIQAQEETARNSVLPLKGWKKE